MGIVIVLVAVLALSAGVSYQVHRTLTALNERKALVERNLSPNDLAKTRLIGSSMARLLQRGLDDPMYRTSNGWEEQARDLVEAWTGERP
jgi:hypothetical protein